MSRRTKIPCTIRVQRRRKEQTLTLSVQRRAHRTPVTPRGNPGPGTHEAKAYRAIGTTPHPTARAHRPPPDNTQHTAHMLTCSRVQLGFKLSVEVGDIHLLQHRADNVLTQMRHHDWGAPP